MMNTDIIAAIANSINNFKSLKLKDRFKSSFGNLIIKYASDTFDADSIKNYYLFTNIYDDNSSIGLFLLSLPNLTSAEIETLYKRFVDKKGSSIDIGHLRELVACNPNTPTSILEKICKLSPLSLERVCKNPGPNAKPIAKVIYKVLFKKESRRGSFRYSNWRLRRLESVMCGELKKEYEELKNIKDLLDD